jgi:hypothetical protein
MTMARTPNTPTELMNDVELIPGISDAQNQLSAMQALHSDERDTLNQMIGQIQMTGAISKLTTVVGLSKLAHIKETRMYKALAGKKGVDRNGNEIADVGTWEGFCLAIGTTRQKADEDILNLKAFGEEALDDLGRIGAGYRDLRKFRKLPEDERVALIEVAKAGDKESFVELAEEIIAKSTREKDALKKELDYTRADYEAQSEVLSDTQTRLTEVRLEAERAKRRIQSATPDQAAKELRIEAQGVHVETLSVIKTRLLPAVEALLAHSDESGIDHRQFLGAAIAELEAELIAIREAHQLPVGMALDGSAVDWMDEDKIADINAEIEQQRAAKGL